MKRTKILLLLFLASLITITQSCSSHKTIVKEMRYDGIYKVLEREGNVSYYKFHDKIHFSTINYHKGSEEDAISILSGSKAKKYPYRNYGDEIRYTVNVGKYGGQGSIRKNKDGALAKSFFLVISKGKIIGRIDNRVTALSNIYAIDGRKILKSDYEEVKWLTDNTVITVKKGLYGIRDLNDKKILDEKYEYIGEFKENFARIKIGGKWGFINQDYKIVIQPSYDHIENFKDGIATVKVINRWFLINKQGKKVIPRSFDRIGRFDSKTLVPVIVSNNRYWNFINIESKRAYKFATSQYYIKKDSFMTLYYKNKQLLIDKNGKPVIPYYFERISCVDKNRFIIKAKKKFGIIDAKVKTIIPPVYDDINPVYQNKRTSIYFKITKGDKTGVVDYSGKLVVPLRKGTIYSQDNGYFVSSNMSLSNETAALFRLGKKEPIFTAASILKISDKYYSFKTNVRRDRVRQSGAFDINGRIVVGEEYDMIFKGGEDQFRVNSGRKWGIISADNKVIQEVDYDKVSYANGIYILTKGDHSYIYSKKEKTLKQFKNTKFHGFVAEKFIIVMEGKKWGLMNFEGKTVLPTIYDFIHFDKKLKKIVTKSYKKGLPPKGIRGFYSKMY